MEPIKDLEGIIHSGEHTCTPESCPAGDHYYVTCVDHDRFWKMSGPYLTHDAALADVDMCRKIANEHDGRSWFMGWGTARFGATMTEPGNLNKLGLVKLLDVRA